MAAKSCKIIFHFKIKVTVKVTMSLNLSLVSYERVLQVKYLCQI